jgi:hypothetical protein
MNLNITPYHFEQIVKSGFTLDMVYFLKLIDSGVDVSPLCELPKIDVLCQSVRRKGLVTEDFKITMIGKSILGLLDEEGTPELKLVKKKAKSDDFDEWWKAYPGTDTFTHKRNSFTGSRSMRVKKDDCKSKLNAIIAEGEYKIEELIAALEFEVLQKKENSIKAKANKLTFMQNSLTYLNQRTFEPFIELIKAGVKIEDSPKESRGSVDI